MKIFFTFITILLSNYMIAQTGWKLQTNPLGYGEDAINCQGTVCKPH